MHASLPNRDVESVSVRRFHGNSEVNNVFPQSRYRHATAVEGACKPKDSKILPLVKKGLDVLLPIGLTAGVTLIIIVSSSFLLSKGNAWQGFQVWLGYIERADTLATITLTALVTATYLLWRQGRERR